MVGRLVRIGGSFVLLLVATRLGSAAVTNAEDLTGCRLQNGRAVLPAAGSQAATNGPLYKFSNNIFSAYPAAADGTPLAPDDAQARLRESGSADVQFLPDKQGSLWAFSGAISEVPEAFYLADLSGKKLDQPWPIPKSSTNHAGQCPVSEAGIYLLQTTDARYVLFRVLEITPTSAVIQFVYQPAGTLTFDIPANPRVAYNQLDAPAAPRLPLGPAASNPTLVLPATAPARAAFPDPATAPAPITATAPRLPLDLPPAPRPLLGPSDVNEPGVIRLLSPASVAPGQEAALDGFIRERTQLLQRRLDIIAAPARTPAEIDRKAQAVADLAALHVDEPQVADLLVAEISFFNPRSGVRDFSPDALHPCFAALKRLGKPATAAALAGVGKLDLDAPGEGIDSAVYKAKLLGMVVRSVEGDAAAEFLFRQQAAKETDPKRRAVFEFLLNK